MRAKKSIFNMVVVCFFTYLTNASQASMMEQWDTKKLTSNSESVRIGQVKDQWSSWDPEKRIVYTYTKMVVTQTIKGKAQEEVLIRQAGGRTKNIGMVVHGMASFQPGERAVVFLNTDRDGAPTVVGMSQGKYRIVNDPKTKKDMALFHAPHNSEFVKRLANGKARLLKASQVNRELPLTTFIDEVHAAMKPESFMQP